MVFKEDQGSTSQPFHHVLDCNTCVVFYFCRIIIFFCDILIGLGRNTKLCAIFFYDWKINWFDGHSKNEQHDGFIMICLSCWRLMLIFADTMQVIVAGVLPTFLWRASPLFFPSHVYSSDLRRWNQVSLWWLDQGLGLHHEKSLPTIARLFM